MCRLPFENQWAPQFQLLSITEASVETRLVTGSICIKKYWETVQANTNTFDIHSRAARSLKKTTKQNKNLELFASSLRWAVGKILQVSLV